MLIYDRITAVINALSLTTLVSPHAAATRLENQQSVRPVLWCAALCLLLLTSLQAWATAGHNHSHGAHVHGRLQLQLVQEQNRLALNLLSPAANLLVADERHTDALTHLKTTLADAQALFEITPGSCKLSALRADFSQLEAWYRAPQEAEQKQHQDVEVHYEFRCQSAKPLRALATTLLDHFPAIQLIEVQWLVNGRQGASTLDNSHRQIQFR